MYGVCAAGGASRPAHAVPEFIQESGATVLDVRALPAPEPLVRALSAADALSPGGELTVLTTMLPVNPASSSNSA